MARNANAAIRSVEACACASTRAASGYAHSISTRWIVIATEGYEQFAEDLQKEIEEDTGIHFGIVEKHQFASIPITDADCQTAALGVVSSEAIWNHLKEAGDLDAKGKFQGTLRQALKEGTAQVHEEFKAQLPQVVEVLRKLAGRMDRHQERRRATPGEDARGHSP